MNPRICTRDPKAFLREEMPSSSIIVATFSILLGFLLAVWQRLDFIQPQVDPMARWHSAMPNLRKKDIDRDSLNKMRLRLPYRW